MGIVSRLKNNSFLHNTFKLAAGTLINQGILFLATPFLTRLYDPEDFGHLAIFVSIATLCSVIFSLRLENALVLVPEEKNVNYLAKVIFSLIGLMALAAMIIFLLLTLIFPSYLYWSLVIVQGALIAFFNVLMFSFHRRKLYTMVSFFIIVQTMVLLAANFTFGFVGVNKGLVWSAMISYLVVDVFMLYRLVRITNWRECKIDKTVFKSTIKDHRHFFSYTTTYTVIGLAFQSAIPLLISFFYSDRIVGYYSLSNRLLRAPFLLFVGSMGNVFKNDLSEIYMKSRASAYAFYKSMSFKLLLIAIAILVVYIISSPYIFSMFLGKEWGDAEVYGIIVAFMVAVDIVEVPLNFVYSLLQKISVQVKILVAMLLAMIIIIPVFHTYFHSAVVSLTVLAVIYCLGGFCSIFYGFRLMKRL